MNKSNTKSSSKRPQCDAHTPLPLSKHPQNGRSMIEMLGVLAIIGVLSVGGIMGYSKAMMRYRINKTIEQISLIKTNIQTAYINQKKPDAETSKYDGLQGNLSLVKKLRLAPEEMWQTDANGNITALHNVFGGEVEIYTGGHDGFTLTFRDLPVEACIEVGIQDWNKVAGDELVAVCAADACAEDKLKGCEGYNSSQYGDILGCVGSSTVGIPLPFEDVVRACDVNGDGSDFSITYY